MLESFENSIVGHIARDIVGHSFKLVRRVAHSDPGPTVLQDFEVI